MSWALRYHHSLREVYAMGEPVQLRGGPARELRHLIFPCTPPGWQEIEGRGGSAEFARLEQLCYLGGVEPWVLGRVSRRYEELCYRPGMKPSWPDAYGPRLSMPMLNVVTELSRYPESLRAVAVIWRSNDVWKAAQDEKRTLPVPCTVALQFLVRNGAVEVHSVMRSCDVWLGLYYDAPAFAFLGRCVAFALRRPFGTLWFGTTSLHLYDRDRAIDHVGTRVVQTVNPLWGWREEHGIQQDELDGAGPPAGPREARARWRGLTDYARADVARWKEEHPG